jgi:hypothetical protein
MVSAQVQEHCDWCAGALSARSRDRSRWLGLASQDAWACDACVASGRYRVPPEWWQGDAGDWLAADQLVLDADDRLAIANALNEVLHGPDAIEVSEFQTRIGVDRDAALRTLRRVQGR